MSKKLILILIIISCLGSLTAPATSSAQTASSTQQQLYHLAEQLIAIDNALINYTTPAAKKLRLVVARILRNMGIVRGTNGTYSTSSLAYLATSTQATTTSPSAASNNNNSQDNRPAEALTATPESQPTWFGNSDDSGAQDYLLPETTTNPDGSFTANIGPKIDAVPGKSSAGSQKIYEEAYAAVSGQKPVSTSQYGRVGCAFAVATILERAGLGVGKPDDLTSTRTLNETLNKSPLYQAVGNYETAFNGAVQGDIVMSPTTENRTGHTGICMDSKCTLIASNSSGQKKFVRNYTQLNWVARFGKNIIIYHAK